MSDIATSGGGEMAEFGPEATAALATLPAGYRKAAGFFWLMNAHVFQTPLPLVARLRFWIANEGLTPDEMRAVFHRLAASAVSAGHVFLNQLMADLAAAVADAVRQRRQREEQERRRQTAAQRDAEALPPTDLRALLYGIGLPPDGG